MQPHLFLPTHTLRRTPRAAALLALTSAIWMDATPLAHADTGKLLLPGGVNMNEDAAGGGLSAWAVIGSQATEGENGVSAFMSSVDGVALLPNVPEGAARLRAWHPEPLLEATPTASTIRPVTAMSAPTGTTPRRRRL